MIDNQLFTNSFSSLFMVVRVALNTMSEVGNRRCCADHMLWWQRLLSRYRVSRVFRQCRCIHTFLASACQPTLWVLWARTCVWRTLSCIHGGHPSPGSHSPEDHGDEDHRHLGMGACFHGQGIKGTDSLICSPKIRIRNGSQRDMTPKSWTLN